jgi:twitching motility protein PilT
VSPYASEAFLQQLLSKALAAGASDVHLEVGQPPGGRVRGGLAFFRSDTMQPEDTEAALRVLGRDERLEHDAVFAYEAAGVGRFRVAAFRARGAVALVLRSIPLAIPTVAALGLPREAAALVEAPRGLVVLAGAPGSGRSTTAAALVGHVNETRPCHIVTFEDPVEHVHEPRRATIAQRTIGADVASLAGGLRAAARQDADVLFAADLRSADALDAALDAAERSLVLAVLLARDVPRAVAQLSAKARSLADGPARLAGALRGAAAQRLSAPAEGEALAPSVRVLAVDERVRDVLRRAVDPASDVELSRVLREHAFE